MKKDIVIIILLIIILFSFTGCGQNQNDENVKIEKLDSEIQYLDAKLISLMNGLNNISFTNYKILSEDVKQQNGQETSEAEKSNKERSGKKEESSSQSESSNSNSQSESSSEGSSNSKQGGQSSSESGGQSSSKNEEKNEIYSLTENNLLSLDFNKDINWDLIKNEIENLYSIWTTIIIDLHSAGVNNEDILKFNTFLDSLAKSAKEENKSQTLTNLSNLYNLLPKYLNSYSKDELKISVYNTKSYLLTAYSMANSEDKWEEMKIEILKANQEFSNIINNITIEETKKINVNRSYLLLREAQKSIEAKNKEVFFIKYKNAIQELNML